MDLAAILDDIERNLAGDLSLERLALRVRLSPHHFHRRFSVEVGEPPMQYVRRLRLEAAAVRLTYSQRSVTDIAFGAGYATHEGFTRAFHRRFGIAPLGYRAVGGVAAPPVGFAPRLVRLPARRIAVLRHVGPYDRSAETCAHLASWAVARGQLGGEMLVMYLDDQSITKPHQTRCDVALVVDGRALADGAVRIRDLPGGTHAVIPQAGAVSERRRYYDVAFRCWLPSIGQRPSGRPFEVYAVRDGVVDQFATTIHIPLRAR